MDAFQKLFGIPKSQIKRDCILSPLNEAELFSDAKAGPRSRGDYFRVADSPHATVIATRYSLLVGDCVLLLADSPCRNIYLFNCCGGIGLKVGTKFLVRKAFNFESFGQMLKGHKRPTCSYADRELMQELREASQRRLREATTATVGSLVLEEEYLPRFKALGVDCLDMECSAVFSAARKAGKRAAALLYASNSIPDKPWHECLDKSDIQRLSQARKDAARLLLDHLALKARRQAASRGARRPLRT